MRRRRKYISANGFSPQTNRAVGSFFYSVFYISIFFGAYKIWGTDVFSEVWFWVFNVLAFWLVKALLIFVGFWKY